MGCVHRNITTWRYFFRPHNSPSQMLYFLICDSQDSWFPLPCVSTSNNPSSWLILSPQASNLNVLLYFLTSQKALVISDSSTATFSNYFLHSYPSFWLQCAFSSTNTFFTLRCLILTTMDGSETQALSLNLPFFTISINGTDILLHPCKNIHTKAKLKQLQEQTSKTKLSHICLPIPM